MPSSIHQSLPYIPALKPTSCSYTALTSFHRPPDGLSCAVLTEVTSSRLVESHMGVQINTAFPSSRLRLWGWWAVGLLAVNLVFDRTDVHGLPRQVCCLALRLQLLPNEDWVGARPAVPGVLLHLGITIGKGREREMGEIKLH